MKAGKGAASRVQYTATGLRIDGTVHSYKQRERMATGLAHSDLAIRVAGVDVPLSAALALLGVGIGEFMAADAAALARATPEELAKRASLVQPPKVARSIRELQEAVQSAATKQAVLYERAAVLRERNPFLPEGSALAAAFNEQQRMH